MNTDDVVTQGKDDDGISPRRKTAKRKTVDELSYILRKHIVEEFEMRGPGSYPFIAADCETQVPALFAMVLHDLLRWRRRIDATLVLKGAGSPERKPIAREHGLEIVVPKKSA